MQFASPTAPARRPRDRHLDGIQGRDIRGRGGSGDAAIHAKQVYSEQYASEMRLPVVRLLDGASGGGSVKMAQEAGYTYLPVNPGWDAVVDNLSLVPVVAACLGPTVGQGAARLVMSHLAVMVNGIGQLSTAGPPVVRGGTGEDLTKEELGGAADISPDR
jgi:acetyl-CoA carboxylase carboxyltransferase component